LRGVARFNHGVARTVSFERRTELVESQRQACLEDGNGTFSGQRYTYCRTILFNLSSADG
jgi:hypothetical protein